MTIKKCLIFLLFVSVFNILHSQIDREFWFAIPKETSGHGTLSATNNVSFKITASKLDAHVTIQMPGDTSGIFPTRYINVSAGQTQIAVLATNFNEFANVYNNKSASGVSAVTGKTTRGIQILSDNDISVLYDYDNYYNREFFSLKGKNGLGTEFYTPFQTIWHAVGRGGDAFTPKGMSTIEIVATEDNTIIDIYPTVQFQGRSDLLAFSITLNRGEAYSLVSSSLTKAPAGTRIKSRDGRKIAVVINDDSVQIGGLSSCRDIIGDQLVPVDIIGSKYIVCAGDRSTTRTGLDTPPYKYPEVGEQIFVTSSQPNTIINFYGKDGTLLYQSAPLEAGQSDYFTVDIDNSNMTSIFIASTDDTKKFYVFHTTGIGCELGGALVPPVIDCVGSNIADFYRSNTVTDIMAFLTVPYDTTLPFSDLSQAHNYFSMVRYNGTAIDTVLIPGSWFEPSVLGGWAVLKTENRNFNNITLIGKTHKIINTKSFFHLGVLQGTSGLGIKYSYITSFNATQSEVFIPQSQTDHTSICLGQTINLVAKGGLGYTWHYGSPAGPPLYLSDPKSATPEIINCPVGDHNFYVVVQNSKCFGVDTLKVSVKVIPNAHARFSVSKKEVCSQDTVEFINLSESAQVYTWKKQTDNGPEYDMLFKLPNSEMLFAESLINTLNTNSFIKYRLIAESYEGCRGDTSITITVNPKVKAGFTPMDTTGITPFVVTFKSNSIVNDSAIYLWDFGNGPNSLLQEPAHTFYNVGTSIINYVVRLLVSNANCVDSATGIIRVMPEPTNISNSVSDLKCYIYPNPVKGKLHICYSLNKPEVVKFEFFSENGTLLYRSSENKNKSGKNETIIDANRIPGKVFFVKLYFNNIAVLFKGIKE
jgi:hypothetical protein